MSAIISHLDEPNKWAALCGNVKSNGPSSCCPTFTVLTAYENATVTEAILGAAAFLLVSLYKLILAAIFVLPLVLIGGLIHLFSELIELCAVSEASKSIKGVGGMLWLLGLSLALDFADSAFHIFATLAAHCSAQRLPAQHV